MILKILYILVSMDFISLDDAAYVFIVLAKIDPSMIQKFNFVARIIKGSKHHETEKYCLNHFLIIFICFGNCRFKIKYHPEESIKRKDEQISGLKVRIKRILFKQCHCIVKHCFGINEFKSTIVILLILETS